MKTERCDYMLDDKELGTYYCGLCKIRTKKHIVVSFKEDTLGILRCEYKSANGTCYCPDSYMDDYDYQPGETCACCGRGF